VKVASRSYHSDRKTSAVEVRAAKRPGMIATRLVEGSEPMTTRTTDVIDTVGAATT
jgi:hypothetical protein